MMKHEQADCQTLIEELWPAGEWTQALRDQWLAYLKTQESAELVKDAIHLHRERSDRKLPQLAKVRAAMIEVGAARSDGSAPQTPSMTSMEIMAKAIGMNGAADPYEIILVYYRRIYLRCVASRMEGQITTPERAAVGLERYRDMAVHSAFHSLWNAGMFVESDGAVDTTYAADCSTCVAILESAEFYKALDEIKKHAPRPHAEPAGALL